MILAAKAKGESPPVSPPSIPIRSSQAEAVTQTFIVGGAFHCGSRRSVEKPRALLRRHGAMLTPSRERSREATSSGTFTVRSARAYNLQTA